MSDFVFSASPEIHVFTTKAKQSSNVVLTCHATGFYPKEITLNIRRNGRILNKEDGVMSTGVRPNHDDTFQRRDYVEILRSDTAKYTCEIFHPGSGIHVNKTWDYRLPEDSQDIYIGVSVGIFVGIGGVLAIVVGVVLQYKKIKLCCKEKSCRCQGGDCHKSTSSESDGSLTEAFIKVDMPTTNSSGSVDETSPLNQTTKVDKPTTNSSASVDETSPLNQKTKGSDLSLSSGDSAVICESDGSLNAALIKVDKPTTNSSGSVDETSPLNKTTKVDKPKTNSSGSVDETSPLNKTTKVDKPTTNSSGSVDETSPLNKTTKVDKPKTNSSASVDETSPLNQTTKASPEIHVFTIKAKQSSNVVLTCHATGFYPKEITLNI
ncbi:uncharacterized protein LOC112139674, partial [Oryzias melastigma]|uniref:uncharacterized protein LOC112139674 n=1 Tax=Oryzias melastigma TaxID=30732 RepID=UPI00168D068E